MHKPVARIDRKPVGLTGEFRFRTQRFTGKQILQVGFMYEVRRYTYSNELQDPDWPFTTEIEWQDAEPREAMMLVVGQSPFPSKKLDIGDAKFDKEIAEFRIRRRKREQDNGILRPSEAPMWGDCSGLGEPYDPDETPRVKKTEVCEHHWERRICPDIYQPDYFVCTKCNATKDA